MATERLRQFQRIVDFVEPFEQQYDWSCGPASLAICYRAFDMEVTEDQLVKELDSAEDGTDWKDMCRSPMMHGLSRWYREHASYEDLVDIYQVTGYPAIVGWTSSRGDTRPEGHYSVIKEVNPAFIKLADPSFGDYVIYRREEFERLWRDEETSHAYMVVVPR